MSAKISSSGNDVKNNETAKIKENFNIFNVDDHNRFKEVWKKISEVNFQKKSLQISDYPDKLGKLMLCVKRSIININKVYQYNTNKN